MRAPGLSLPPFLLSYSPPPIEVSKSPRSSTIASGAECERKWPPRRSTSPLPVQMASTERGTECR
eukprot:scaffold318249_cov27-Tisochrysis_lutea.AAC.1